MKILMVAPQPFFEPRGTPFSVLGRLKALSKLGHEVDLVTYHIGEDVAIPGVVIFRIPTIPFIKKISIGPSLKKLFLDGFLLTKTATMLIGKRYDLLHSHEEASFFSILFAKVFRIPHLYDMHSSLPQQLSNFHYTNWAPIVGLFGFLERLTINSSQAVITICPALETQVKTINAQAPHLMIENMTIEGSPEDVSEEDVQAFKKSYGLHDRRIILYAGTFETYQGIPLLIECAQKVVEKIPKVIFVMMGGTSQQVEEVQGQVHRLDLTPHFCFTGSRPPGDIPCAIRAAEILVSPRVKGTNTPLKIYAYLESAKPIVATNLSTHTQVLNDKVAILVEPNSHDFADGIIRALSNQEEAKEFGRCARALFEERFSYNIFLEKTKQILDLALKR